MKGMENKMSSLVDSIDAPNDKLKTITEFLKKNAEDPKYYF
jgi:hypothetical protein